MSMKMKFELLPNEIFIECFQYLNTFDIFYSFGQLNYRFYTLIRNSSLHLNFQQLKKSKFNQFCQIILSNPEMKNKIISLKLSNEDTRGQIQEFLSLFSLNEFVNLRSLSLICLKDDNALKLLPVLPFLSNLSNFSFTDLKNRTFEIIFALSKLKLQIVSIPNFDYCLPSYFKKMSITSLTISDCDLFDLCELFKDASILKHLKIESFSNNLCIMIDPSQLPTGNAVYLKQLILDYSSVKFEILEILLKRIPNLTIFKINAPHQTDMIDADRWQHLIESSLSHLRVFNFYFRSAGIRCYNEKLNRVQKFQTNFWCKQHHWDTNYEITWRSASIYTMPYVANYYELVPIINRYGNSNGFDNVTTLHLSRMAITDNSPYYFKNVESLTLTNEYDNNGKSDEYKLQETQIKFLNKIINLSNITHLGLADACKMDLSSSLLLKILDELPYVSSLNIDKHMLLLFLNNDELCEYLNRKIYTLYISGTSIYYPITSDEVHLLCKTFSNIERLYCHIGKLDDLLLILRQCSKLSIINIQTINEDIYSWININASKLNLYIDFDSIDDIDEPSF